MSLSDAVVESGATPKKIPNVSITNQYTKCHIEMSHQTYWQQTVLLIKLTCPSGLFEQ